MNRETIQRDAAAGLVGGVAFLAEMSIDLALFRNRTNDLVLLGGALTSNRRRALVTGTMMHLIASTGMGIAHGQLNRHMGRSGNIRTGIEIAMIENAGLYPLILFERFHPAHKRGEIQSFLRPVPVVQELLRHLAFGAAMGWTSSHFSNSQHRAKDS